MSHWLNVSRVQGCRFAIPEGDSDGYAYGTLKSHICVSDVSPVESCRLGRELVFRHQTMEGASRYLRQQGCSGNVSIRFQEIT